MTDNLEQRKMKRNSYDKLIDLLNERDDYLCVRNAHTLHIRISFQAIGLYNIYIYIYK